MSTAHVEGHGYDGESDSVIPSLEEEAALVQRLAETEESEEAGRLIPWEKLRASRDM